MRSIVACRRYMLGKDELGAGPLPEASAGVRSPNVNIELKFLLTENHKTCATCPKEGRKFITVIAKTGANRPAELVFCLQVHTISAQSGASDRLNFGARSAL
jgi:hypothetical protein